MGGACMAKTRVVERPTTPVIPPDKLTPVGGSFSHLTEEVDALVVSVASLNHVIAHEAKRHTDLERQWQAERASLHDHILSLEERERHLQSRLEQQRADMVQMVSSALHCFTAPNVPADDPDDLNNTLLTLQEEKASLEKKVEKVANQLKREEMMRGALALSVDALRNRVLTMPPVISTPRVTNPGQIDRNVNKPTKPAMKKVMFELYDTVIPFEQTAPLANTGVETESQPLLAPPSPHQTSTIPNVDSIPISSVKILNSPHPTANQLQSSSPRKPPTNIAPATTVNTSGVPQSPPTSLRHNVLDTALWPGDPTIPLSLCDVVDGELTSAAAISSLPIPTIPIPPPALPTTAPPPLTPSPSPSFQSPTTHPQSPALWTSPTLAPDNCGTWYSQPRPNYVCSVNNVGYPGDEDSLRRMTPEALWFLYKALHNLGCQNAQALLTLDSLTDRPAHGRPCSPTMYTPNLTMPSGGNGLSDGGTAISPASQMTSVLSPVADPSDGDRFFVIKRLLQEVPGFLDVISRDRSILDRAVQWRITDKNENSPDGLQLAAITGGCSLTSINALFDFYEIQQLISHLTHNQIARLSRGIPQTTSANHLCRTYMTNLRETLIAIDQRTLECCHSTLLNMPPSAQRSTMLKIIPRIRPEAIPLFSEIFKLPLSELVNLKDLICMLKPNQLSQLYLFLQLEVDISSLLKTHMAPEYSHSVPNAETFTLPNATSIHSTMSSSLPSDFSLDGGNFFDDLMYGNFDPPVNFSLPDLPMPQSQQTLQVHSQIQGKAHLPNIDSHQVDAPSQNRPPQQNSQLQQAYHISSQAAFAKQTSPVSFPPTTFSSPIQPYSSPLSNFPTISSLVAAPPAIPSFAPTPIQSTPQELRHISTTPIAPSPSTTVTTISPGLSPLSLSPQSPSEVQVKQRKYSAKSASKPYSRQTPTRSPMPNSDTSKEGSPPSLPPVPLTSSPNMSTQPSPLSGKLSLKLSRAPPNQTVYQRILRPHPAVMVVGPADLSTDYLFIAVTLRRSDNDEELPAYLEGTKFVMISKGVFAVFNKLKILCTTQQQGAQFYLRFTLFHYIGEVFFPVQGATARSDPIEVFSHTVYLRERKEAGAKPAPLVEQLLPPSGPPGTRVVILGKNFAKEPSLRVAFHDTVIFPQFHEECTLICQVPHIPGYCPGAPVTVAVRVTNDGIKFSQGTTATFTYCNND
ncbi:calcium-activated BK potassium channel [Pelomyxa schiedti]|nr:calcium-activated BK potassium channel [Pelomyxa schiedti]